MINLKKETAEFEKYFFEKELKRLEDGKKPSPALLRVQFIKHKEFISLQLKKGKESFLIWKYLSDKKLFSGTFNTFKKHLKRHNLSENLSAK